MAYASTAQRAARRALENLSAAVSVHAPFARRESPYSTHNFNIDQMRNNERLVAFGEFLCYGIGQKAVRKKFDDD